MSNYVKEKNFIIISLPPLRNSNSQRVYRYDINTGHLYGKRNVPLANAPSGLADYVRGWRNNGSWVGFYLCALIGCSGGGGIMNLDADELQNLRIADRIDALGVYCSVYSQNCSQHRLRFVNEHFSKFVEYCREKAAENDRNWNLEDFQNYCYESSIEKGLGLKIDEHCPRGLIRRVMVLLENRHESDAMIKGTLPHIKMYRQIAAWYTKGAYRLGETYGHRFFDSLFRSTIDAAVAMEMTEFPKGDAIRVCDEILRTYNIKKQELDDKRLADFQRKRWAELSFEYDDYQVIIPTTSAEFEAEAEQQHNCVFSMYLNKVVEGRTHVVFIRKKADPTKSVITCEVGTDGHIYQFLGHHNTQPSDPILRDFKIAYQRYLNMRW